MIEIDEEREEILYIKNVTNEIYKRRKSYGERRCEEKLGKILLLRGEWK